MSGTLGGVRGRLLKRLSWPGVVVAVLAIALVAFAGERTLAWRESQQREEASAAVLEAARTHVLALTTDAQARTTGSVESAGLTELDEDRAVVVVAASSVVRTDAKKKPSTSRYRLRLSLQEKGDQWLVARVELVP